VTGDQPIPIARDCGKAGNLAVKPEPKTVSDAGAVAEQPKDRFRAGVDLGGRRIIKKKKIKKCER
jgi:hypothetical protein